MCRHKLRIANHNGMSIRIVQLRRSSHSLPAINTDDVVGPPTPGSAAAIVSIPSEAYLPSLTQETGLRHPNLRVIVHYTPAELVSDTRYLEWVHSFGGGVSLVFW
jgi:hypothetical protein